MAAHNPAELARETLKLLASRRLPPTPSNYQAIYEEVAGLAPQVIFPLAPLRRIASILPTQTPVQKRITQDFAAAVEAKDWTALQSAIADFAQQPLGSPSVTALSEAAPIAQEVLTLPASTADQLARAIENTMTVLGDEDVRMRELSDQLAHFLRTAPPPLPALEQMLHNYSYRLSFTAEDQAQRQQSMVALMRMVCDHITATAAHDQPLQHHSQALNAALQAPWTLAQLDTIQTHLKNLLFRHLELEGQRSEAQEQLKELLALHAQQMAKLSQRSDTHASELQTCAEQLQAAHELGDLAQALQAVVHSGSALATENRMVQAQLSDLRAQALAQEQALAAMSEHIAALTNSTRHDSDTGALNLDGLHETFASEAARAQRRRTTHTPTISVAALEIDHWDQLPLHLKNPALVHLARLARSNLRPQDALGRVTPQGFAIVFPNTEPAEAAQALARLQSQLQSTKLVQDEHKHNLSFSAGVIASPAESTAAEAFAQAAKACEQAQHMGTSRITIQ